MKPVAFTLVMLAALSGASAWAADRVSAPTPHDLALVNRVTWGVASADVAEEVRLGADRWLERQLRPFSDGKPPPAVQQEIAALPIAQRPMADLVIAMNAQNKAVNQITDPGEKKVARQAYQQAFNDLGRQAAVRSLLRDLYGPDQLREQMTWFWLNHFNVHMAKRDIRAMVGDYEDQAIRPHALGRFRDLLEATLRHPAMLRYLDNDQNAAGRINENYAREIMELHTLGVGSGYTQQDVEELARTLTGVGVDTQPSPPKLKPGYERLYLRSGLFEFNPNRHDFGDKLLLGHVIKGSGFGEVEQALDILAREPATAHHVCQEMAVYFVGDAPPPDLVDAMAQSFRRSDGDIAVVLRTLFRSRAFDASLKTRFKDPVHFALSAVRLAYDGRVVANAQPIQGWINRMGEGLFERETPDGYPLGAAAWDGPGQLAVRFEIARQIGTGPAGLFKPDAPNLEAQNPYALVTVDQPAFPQLQNALYFQGLSQTLGPTTSAALGQARSPQGWNALFLSSPEFMHR